MKKTVKIPVIFLALFLLFPFYDIKAFSEDETFKINGKLSVPKLKLMPNTFILDYKTDDVNGDNIKDNILLVGSRKEPDNAVNNEGIRLIIQDGKSKKFYKITPGKIDSGYGGSLFLGDFNGDRIQDVFVSFVRNGNSYYSVVSFKNNKSRYLFDEEHFSKGLSFDITYVDNFNVNIFNKEVSKYYIIDVLNKKNTYIYEGIYDRRGKVLVSQKGMQSTLSELTPIDIDKDGVYELKAMQKLSGICAADTIGYAKALWKFENSRINLLSLDILPYAKPKDSERTRRVIPVSNFSS